jgi:hypothetical protein
MFGRSQLHGKQKYMQNISINACKAIRILGYHQRQPCNEWFAQGSVQVTVVLNMPCARRRCSTSWLCSGVRRSPHFRLGVVVRSRYRLLPVPKAAVLNITLEHDTPCRKRWLRRSITVRMSKASGVIGTAHEEQRVYGVLFGLLAGHA